MCLVHFTQKSRNRTKECTIYKDGLFLWFWDILHETAVHSPWFRWRKRTEEGPQTTATPVKMRYMRVFVRIYEKEKKKRRNEETKENIKKKHLLEILLWIELDGTCVKCL